MQNPFQQAATGNLNDPLAFVKKLWGDMQLPGMVTPTLSVDELDKQIKDLKTVESWLNVNMNMLKGTIQALEVQRATISALKTMGESFAQAGNATSKAATAHAADTSHARWPMHGNNHAATSNVVPEPSVEENEEEDEEDEGLSAQQEPPASAASTSTPNEQAPFHNPAAWWTVLQDQFKQALSHAMKDEAADATSDQSTPQAKRAAKSASTGQSATTMKSGSKTPRKVAAKTPVVKAKSPVKNTQKLAAKATPKNSTKKPTKSPIKSRAA